MATKMHILAVIQALLEGGYICWECEPVWGKNTYTVHEFAANNMPNKQLGHITEKQFRELMQYDLIQTRSDKQTKDKSGHIYTAFVLRKIEGTGGEEKPVTPVTHAHWVQYLGGKVLGCSACTTTFHDEKGNGGSLYCPQCGAEMNGGENDG